MTQVARSGPNFVGNGIIRMESQVKNAVNRLCWPTMIGAYISSPPEACPSGVHHPQAPYGVTLPRWFDLQMECDMLPALSFEKLTACHRYITRSQSFTLIKHIYCLHLARRGQSSPSFDRTSPANSKSVLVDVKTWQGKYERPSLVKVYLAIQEHGFTI